MGLARRAAAADPVRQGLHRDVPAGGRGQQLARVGARQRAAVQAVEPGLGRAALQAPAGAGDRRRKFDVVAVAALHPVDAAAAAVAAGADRQPALQAPVGLGRQRRFVGAGLNLSNESDWSGFSLAAAGGVSYERNFGRFSVRPEAYAEYFSLSEDGHVEEGGGDGFASGFFYGLLTGEPPEEAVKLGWAHGALLTTFPGDTTMSTVEQVKAFAKGGSARIQR